MVRLNLEDRENYFICKEKRVTGVKHTYGPPDEKTKALVKRRNEREMQLRFKEEEDF